jgi:acyl-CoA dehydrogenase
MPMDTAQDETLAILRDSAERCFRDLSTREAINAAESGTWPAGSWSQLEDLGFTRAALPEAAEGAGLALGDALQLARIAAAHASPLPLGETLVAGWLLASAGHEVPQGPLSFGPVDGREPPRLRRAGAGESEGWLLDGALHGLPWGEQAVRIALVLDTASGWQVASVRPSLAQATSRPNLAGEPRTRLVFRDARLADADVRPLHAPGIGPQAQVARLLGAALRSQQLAGALATARDLAVRYTGERIAFGKPLNRLQAVQQNLAVLAGQAAAAGVAADMAMGALDAAGARGDDAFDAIAMAKIRTGEAAGIGAGLAHQAHGAIGFTYEHGLHHATRRLWAWRDEFGHEAYWSNQVGARIVRQGPDALWQFVTQAARL